MITKTKMCERTTQRALGGARWFHLMVLMLVLFTGGSPKAWAADSGLDQTTVGDKQYYVLRSADDWETLAATPISHIVAPLTVTAIH